MNKTTFSFILLMATTFIWGFSFLVVQDSFGHGWNPFQIIAIRALLGVVICLPFAWKQTWKNKQLWRDSILCGIFYYFGFAFQAYGQMNSTIANTAFITTLNVVFVPLILFVFLKKKPAKKVYVAVALSLVGTAILSFQGAIGIQLGDALLLLCALGFALQIIFAKKAASHHHPFAATSIQLLTMGILGVFSMGVSGQMTLPSQGWSGMLYIGILATGLVGIFQMIAQRYLSESTTSIVYSFESAVAATAAVVFAYQVFSWRIVVGGLCMLLAVLLVEVNINHKKRKIRQI